MKNILIIFFCTVSAFAQTDTIQRQNLSVVSMENAHIAYRGISNPIKIAVPNAKSFTATAPGLKKKDDYGNYEFNVTTISGFEVTINIDILLNSGKHKHEKQVFEIKDIDFPYIKIGDKKFSRGTTVALSAATLKSKFEFDMPVTSTNKSWITGFEIQWPDKTEQYEDDKLNEKVLKKINALPNGSILPIHIKYYFKGAENYSLKDVYFYLIKSDKVR